MEVVEHENAEDEQPEDEEEEDNRREGNDTPRGGGRRRCRESSYMTGSHDVRDERPNTGLQDLQAGDDEDEEQRPQHEVGDEGRGRLRGLEGWDRDDRDKQARLEDERDEQQEHNVDHLLVTTNGTWACNFGAKGQQLKVSERP